MYGSSRRLFVPALGHCSVSMRLEDSGEASVVVTTGIGTPEEKSSRVDIPVMSGDFFPTNSNMPPERPTAI